MSYYYFPSVLMIVMLGLYNTKGLNKDSVSVVPLVILTALMGIYTVQDITKLNLFAYEPWRFFAMIFMGLLYYVMSKEETQVGLILLGKP